MLSMMSPLVAIGSLAIPFFTQPASANTPLSITSIVIGVVAYVTGLNRDDVTAREEFTQRVIAELNQKYPNHNAVITGHVNHSKAEGPSVIHDDVGLPGRAGRSFLYRIYMSPKGQPFTFHLNGDGGYRNWAFGGNFHRDGNTLTAQ